MISDRKLSCLSASVCSIKIWNNQFPYKLKNLKYISEEISSLQKLNDFERK